MIRELSILAESYEFVDAPMSERSELEISKCTDFYIYSGAKNLLHLMMVIIQTNQLAPTGDLLVYENAAIQAYHMVKQNPGESTNQYRVRMKDSAKAIVILGIYPLPRQQQAMRYLKSWSRTKYEHMVANLMNDALKS